MLCTCASSVDSSVDVVVKDRMTLATGAWDADQLICWWFQFGVILDASVAVQTTVGAAVMSSHHRRLHLGAQAQLANKLFESELKNVVLEN
jgi:hypothetical protein